MASSENCREDVGAPKCWQGRAIENGEEEEPERSQVAEHRRNTVSATRSGILDEDVQHELNISTSPDTFSGPFAPLPRRCLRFERQLRTSDRRFSSTGQRRNWRESRVSIRQASVTLYETLRRAPDRGQLTRSRRPDSRTLRLYTWKHSSGEGPDHVARG